MSDTDATPAPSTPPPADTSYVRTYAKDLAAQGGPNAAAVPPTLAPAPVKAPSAVPEPAAPMPSAPAAPVPPAPEPAPAYIIPNAPSTNEKRESILSRLRAKAGTPEPVAAPASIIPAAPSTNESRQSILDRLHATAATPAPTPAEAPTPMPPVPPQTKDTAPAPLHTYKTDFADTTKSTGATPLSVLATEQDKGGVPARAVLASKPRSSLPLILAGAALLILGTGSVYFAFQFVQGKPVVPTDLFVPSLIFADQEARIEGSGRELRQALLSLSDRDLGEGEVVLAYATYSTTTKNGVVEMPVSGGALLAAMELPFPQIVARNIADEASIGMIRAKGEIRPFFILRVSSYERTFAGMLSWERTIKDDLASFYPAFTRAPIEVVSAATSTATSTKPVATSSPAQPVFIERFRDDIVDNHDVRVLRDEENNTLMVYGYRDKTTLVIARSEEAFREVVRRLAAKGSE